MVVVVIPGGDSNFLDFLDGWDFLDFFVNTVIIVITDRLTIMTN